MRNIKNNIIETGIVETSTILENFGDEDMVNKALHYLPLSGVDMKIRTEKIIEGLISLKKDTLLFLTPEIAVIEKLKDTSIKEIIVCIPANCDLETYERILNNMPCKEKVSFIRENEIPSVVFEIGNAAILSFGFRDGDRALILASNYLMMEKYQNFYGYRVLVSCGEGVSSLRPIGWAPVETYGFFNEVI